MNIPRAPSSPDNLFMSHAWGMDTRGRDTHERVRRIRCELARFGYKVWFDEERLLLGCNIDAKMASGILKADAVCICITRRYVEKVNAGDPNDNVFKEWNYAQAKGKRILPLIMEDDMRDVRTWPVGVMTLYLGNTLYLDCSGNDVKDIARRISKTLRLMGMQPRLTTRLHRRAIQGGCLFRSRSDNSLLSASRPDCRSLLQSRPENSALFKRKSKIRTTIHI